MLSARRATSNPSAIAWPARFYRSVLKTAILPAVLFVGRVALRPSSRSVGGVFSSCLLLDPEYGGRFCTPPSLAAHHDSHPVMGQAGDRRRDRSVFDWTIPPLPIGTSRSGLPQIALLSGLVVAWAFIAPIMIDRSATSRLRLDAECKCGEPRVTGRSLDRPSGPPRERFGPPGMAATQHRVGSCDDHVGGQVNVDHRERGRELCEH